MNQQKRVERLEHTAGNNQPDLIGILEAEGRDPLRVSAQIYEHIKVTLRDSRGADLEREIKSARKILMVACGMTADQVGKLSVEDIQAEIREIIDYCHEESIRRYGPYENPDRKVK